MFKAVNVQQTANVVKASRTLELAFRSKATDYLTKKFFDVPVQEKYSRQRIDAMIHYFTAVNYDYGAHIMEANDLIGVMIYTAPGKHLPVKLTSDLKFNKQYLEKINLRKKEIIPKEIDYYYLFMIGKNPENPNVKGSTRALINDLKNRANNDNCAIVLEAISEQAKEVYRYFGFKTYLTYNYGVGEVNSKGELDSQGCGLTAHLMAYHKDGDKILRN
ncbi:hypothetical protein TBLA_0J00430 [Henningerozyma blattae CBS 6284]|uniref:N-acetyltransferase domain-containing protein n=1 Tax=Henningerozyma blattae (strain ATCC 34711 / CBS 6284 / DSM 70876 / NBRC 10599 / NRRL Y-10934 / UCD 77-7) TaxID=1071380 RepID=I2H9J1_HENB6|nr:hypothetical protein TBLA_0J00430 [Tetrapisispora blattae CBS 6284]CCH63043.1 hypothetical protein TBLA_0J00430 [Tetrapisispora blattae CBS 6284]